jgi:HSP20 family protein
MKMLTRWSPFLELTKFEKDVRDLLSFDGSFCRPSVDVYEDKEKITLEAELPGVEPGEVDITVDGNILSIKGEKSIKSEEKKKEYFRVERSSGSFMRSFTLPRSVDSDKISATYDKGILSIEIPKKPETVPKQIKIKT